MAHRVVNLLEAVEIEHHQRAAASAGAEGGEYRREALVELAAVGEPGQLVDVRLARDLSLVGILRRNIDRTAAMALEVALGIGQRAAVQPPPAGAAACIGHRHDLLVELGTGLELERKAALGGGTRLFLDIVEDLHEGLADKVFGTGTQVFQRALRKEAEVAFRVGCPKHADAEFLDFAKHHGAIGRAAPLRRGLVRRGVSGLAQGLAKA